MKHMFTCKQCKKKYAVSHNPQDYIILNYSRGVFEGHGKYEMHFCGADCAITFLESIENHRMLFWVLKENVQSQFDNKCWYCLRNNEADSPGPYLSIGGGCDTWFDDGYGSEYFCSVEHLIDAMHQQQTAFKKI